MARTTNNTQVPESTIPKNQRVLIINPPWDTHGQGFGCRSNTRWPHIRKDKFLLFPIFLAYSAALLEADGIATRVIDAVAEELDPLAFLKRVRDLQPTHCFLECSTPTIAQDIDNAKLIKEQTASHVFLMGAHPTVFHQTLLEEHPWLDGIIRGEFELTLRDIACGVDYSRIDGLSYRHNGTTHANPDRHLLNDLDELPFPAWHQFHLKDYESHLYTSPSALITATRGCPFQCTYCLWPQVLYGHKQRRRSPENICDEIEQLIARYHVRHVRFDDDTFALNKQYVIACCDEIIKRGLHRKISWNCFGHISQPDPELYRKMAEANCVKIAVGVESGSEKILQLIKKKINLDQAKQMVRNCHAAGIDVYCDFMMGFPYETEDDIERSIQLAIDLDPDYIQVSFAVPYPGTQMYAKGLEQQYLRFPREWEKYASCEAMIDTKSISQERLNELYRIFWHRFYLRPAYIIRTFRKALSSWNNFKKITGGALSYFNRFIRTSL